MQAIILAAGMGKRLKEFTRNNTKCMVKVNEKTLIERALRILDQQNLSRVVIVVGYKGENLKNYIATLDVKTPIEYIDNPIYATTNNIYSLALAKEWLIKEDSLLFESDLIFEKKMVDRLIEDPRPSLAIVDKFESWMDGTCMKLDDEDKIVDFIPGKYLKFHEKDTYFKTVNIYKFSKEFSKNTYMPFLTAYEQAMGDNEYYESVIKLIALLERTEIRAMRLEGECWYEIDNAQDLDIAELLFTEDPIEKYTKLCHRFGGFWRFPKMLDFCYLVNPYFPNPKMVEEISSNFATLMQQYPSGMGVNSLLASGAFGVLKEHILLGNGAAELIKTLVEKHLSGKIGVIRPTFEEYSNRAIKEDVVEYVPDNMDYRYSAKDIISYFTENPVKNIVLINPDNPSGNYIANDELEVLLDWCKQSDISLVIDESFVDFVELEKGQDIDDITLLKEDILQKYSNLFVVKSISKSYGVPGFRLGILACGNSEIISAMKKEVAIWNINSYGEFFLQILEKYKKDYKSALVKHGIARKQLVEGLEKISWLRVIPSQANYVMCEVLEGRKSIELCASLLQKHHILLKDISSKMKDRKQYIRVAIRNIEDNTTLINALEQE